MVIDLIMPEKHKEITVKIVSVPFIAGSDAYVNVIMYGNPQKWIFRMKLGKTLWFSILKYLKEMDNSRFSEELEPSVLTKNLEYLNGRIITVRGISNEKKVFTTKAGTVESPKIFKVDFQYDYEDAERIGGEKFKEAIHKAVHFNYSCHDCIMANTNLAKAEIEIQKQKELEKKMTEEEKRKKRYEESEVEWVKKKVVEDKKKDKQLKQLELAGW